jgi:hypothetical protein
MYSRLVSVLAVRLQGMTKFFFVKKIIFLKLNIFTSNSFRIQSCPDPDADPPKIFGSISGSTTFERSMVQLSPVSFVKEIQYDFCELHVRRTTGTR